MAVLPVASTFWLLHTTDTESPCDTIVAMSSVVTAVPATGGLNGAPKVVWAASLATTRTTRPGVAPAV